MSRQDDVAVKAVRKSTLKSLKEKKNYRLAQLKADYEKAVREVNIQYAEDPERLKAKYASDDYAKSERGKRKAAKKIESEKKLIETEYKSRHLTVGEEIASSIVQGIGILFGSIGEIVTEKSGNLNLGIPGLMYMGGIAGLLGAFFYENAVAVPNSFVGMLISLICTLLCSGLGALIYSFLTITLRANQNVVGLALTTFGIGFGNFFGGSISKLAGGVGQVSVATTAKAYQATIPGLNKIPVIGELLFSYGFLTYIAIVLAFVISFFILRTREGLNLRAVGENPGAADAAGVNLNKYK